ncbi:hypothetical protein GGTG_02280 [Gaeumannomyces tritici R3-111a-1]|uniref:Uncharacterized protein n=1 Tax=Gaeumannomyces tritici (strain R3-111a-1) TaxID=644352 RepID=J3NLX5_GAET3|nr:hypothetical protein GGTG_02280 [Gaeumannomyces tritici R3-111a-1]EJT82306.1 hypothetical protein GGTG_02280 [Gaeumannomyces tritici R3-111a-1]
MPHRADMHIIDVAGGCVEAAQRPADEHTPSPSPGCHLENGHPPKSPKPQATLGRKRDVLSGQGPKKGEAETVWNMRTARTASVQTDKVRVPGHNSLPSPENLACHVGARLLCSLGELAGAPNHGCGGDGGGGGLSSSGGGQADREFSKTRGNGEATLRRGLVRGCLLGATKDHCL